MAATIKTRIQLKNDTEANWRRATNFIPLCGEVIIYNCDDTRHFFRLKVGDGVTKVNQLPFLDSGTINGISIEANTTAAWNTNLHYIPAANSIIIYTDKSTISNNGRTVNVPGIKIGDGLAYLIDLPFVGDEIINEVVSHVNNQEIHITNAEREFWNNKINCEDVVIDECLQLRRN